MTTATEENQQKTVTRRKKTTNQSSGTRTVRKPKTASRAAASPTQEQIAERAWLIWQDQGCPVGCEEHNWFQAETELKAR